jgi:glycosyltransferase involved in cell wall biosynthesis
MPTSLSGRTLYLCYFGLREPLVQTQVLPYLRSLATRGLEVYLLTFEPHYRETWSSKEILNVRDSLAADGIQWFARGYHKTPSALATLYDILIGAWTAIRISTRHRVGVIHARSHMPIAMAILSQLVTDLQIIFDVRGLMADEYVQAGIWRPGSAKYRVTKWLERIGLRRADQIVVLTKRMRDWIVGQKYASADQIQVIPCCVDFARFDRATTRRQMHAASDRFEVVYAGSTTGLYLLEEMGRFFLALREHHPLAFFRILTSGSAEHASRVLRLVGLKEQDFSVSFAEPADLPRKLDGGNVGLSFRKAGFAQIASSPTKIAEYLAAGLPVVSSAGIGDTEELLEGENVGIVVRQFDDASLAVAAEKVLALNADRTLHSRCREVAQRYFDLETIGGMGYADMYQRLQDQHASQD